MKKILNILLCGVCIFCLTGCGQFKDVIFKEIQDAKDQAEKVENKLGKETDKVQEAQKEIPIENDNLLDEQYKNMEREVNEAAITYAIENIASDNKVLQIDILDLLNYGYINRNSILDLKDKSLCNGYAIIEITAVDTSSRAYLSCSNYKTEGYYTNKIK